MASILAALPRDLRFAVRALGSRPSLTFVRIVTLALVMAAASAVFAVADALLLRPLPFNNPDRLLRIYLQPPGTTGPESRNPLYPLGFLRLRGNIPSLEAFEGVWARERALFDGSRAESLASAAVSAGLFQMLSSHPVVGRTFTDEEARDDRRLVVLSHGLWTRRHGARPDVVGTMLQIDGEAHEVIGVMGPEFRAPYVASEFWTPLPIAEGRLIAQASTFVQTIARPRRGATLEQVEAELASALDAIRSESPGGMRGWTIHALDLRTAQLGARRRALTLLLSAAIALALLAAANLANLTLADVLSRRAELAMRTALGATRGALLAPELLQALLVALAGAALGLVLSSGMLPIVLALDPANTSDGVAFVHDARVAVAVSALSALVMLAAAAPPLLRTVRGGLSSVLMEGGRSSMGGRTQARFRAGLVAAQTCLALVLVSAGSLVAGAFDRTLRLDPGFDARGVLGAQIRLSGTAYANEARRTALVDGLLERVRTLPGVTSASTTMNILQPGFAYQTLVHIDGQRTPEGQPHTVLFRRVSPGYFATLKIPHLQGRTFDERDTRDGMPVAIVSESFARRFWPAGDGVGRRVMRGAPPLPWLTIVGVVGDVYDVGFGQDPLPTLYQPYAQNNNAIAPVTLVVRAEVDPLALVPALQSAIAQIDPAQPLGSIRLFEDFLGASLGPQRFRTVLLAIVAGLGFALAVMGVYAVTARTVAERTREAGLRMALGGSLRHVWWSAASPSVRPFALGLAAGVLTTLAVTALLTASFPEIASTPRVYALPAAAGLIAAGLSAAFGAARRIVKISPAVALTRT